MPALRDPDSVRARLDAVQTRLLLQEAATHAAVHDLRTPINTLSGLLYLLNTQMADDLPDKALEYIDYLTRATQQLDDLATALLEQARAGANGLSPHPVDMRAAVNAVIADLYADDTRVHVTGATWTQQADPDLLHLLLKTLLTHADRQPHPTDAPHSTVTLIAPHHLRITDISAGLADAAPFLPSAAPEDAGLMACAVICKRHGWQITAKAEGDSGARFDILCSADLTKI